MRIIIICGDPECGEEYPAETDDRLWSCPHCGRERENLYYPFLTARLMDARIHTDEADWREHHDQLLSKAQGRVAELRDHIGYLRKDLAKLRVRLPEEDRQRFQRGPGEDEVDSFLDNWSPEADDGDGGAWKDLHDRLLEGARGEILALEDVVKGMEDEVRKIKGILGLA
jgi:hypothetical protein